MCQNPNVGKIDFKALINGLLIKREGSDTRVDNMRKKQIFLHIVKQAFTATEKSIF